MADAGFLMLDDANGAVFHPVSSIKYPVSSIEYRIYFVPSTMEGQLVSN
jgi:hypothetical protein